MRIAAIVISFLVTAVVTLYAGRPNESDPPSALRRPLLVLTGAVSEIKQKTYQRISSADQLEKTWRDHVGPVVDQGGHQAPAIDFERCEVIAVFQGTSWNSRGLRVEALADGENGIVVRLDDVSYQTVGDVDTASPYAFILLPKTIKAIVLEENVQGMLNDKPNWKQVARLPQDGHPPE